MNWKTIAVSAIALLSIADAAFIQTRDRAITRGRIQAISKGIQRYWDAYRQLPLALRPDQKSRDVIDILSGKNLWDQNTNRIAFLQDEDFDVRRDEPPLRGDSGLILDGWTNGIVINIDYTTRTVVIRSPGKNKSVDADIGDDEVETVQFEKK